MADPQVIAFPQDRMRARPAPARVLLAFDAVGLRRGGGVVLEDVGFEIAEGGVSCLLGPNGAGKSLCLRLAAGLIAPDHGGITRSVPLTKIAYVPQRPVMLRRSVRGNLGHALRLAGLGRRARRAALEDLLDLARLTHAAHQPAHSLSGGEAQRLALARALAVDPQVLLLDEPAASLDPASTAALEDLIVLTARGGTKVVLVTHDVAQARRLADDVVFLAGGRVRELAPAGRFFDRPASTAGRAYLAGRLLT